MSSRNPNGRLACLILVLIAIIFSTILTRPSSALTTILSANGQPWDVQDVLDPEGPDDGSVNDGGQNAFDNFGSIRVRVLNPSEVVLVDDEPLCGFNLFHDGDRRWSTTNPVNVGASPCGLSESVTTKTAQRLGPQQEEGEEVPGISVTREIFAPTGTDYIRYIDSFTNNATDDRTVLVAFGGNLGSDGCTVQSRSSSGDRFFDTSDTWGVTIENCSSNPDGPSTNPPIGYAFRSPNDTTLQGFGAFFSNPFTTTWAGDTDDSPGLVFTLTLAPGDTRRLAYFVYRGLEEGAVGPLGQTPAAGEQIAAAQTSVSGLVANPDFGDLTLAERDQIVNWPSIADLSITKAVATPGPYVVGQNITYAITLTNNGPGPAVNVQIIDPLPNGVTFQSATAPAGWTVIAPAVGSPGSVGFLKPLVAAGEVASFSIVVRLVSSQPTIVNTVAVSSPTADSTPENNSAVAPLTSGIFSFCIQDGTNILRLALDGSFQFINCAKGITFSGTANLRVSFCKIELNPGTVVGKSGSQGVTGVANTCTLVGTASVRTPSGQVFNLVDQNITNNTCSCP